jgi:hypothetical protein
MKVFLLLFLQKKKTLSSLEWEEGPAEAEACIGFRRWGPQRRGAAFGPVIEAFGASCLLQTHNSVLGPYHRASRRSRAIHAWIDVFQSPAPHRRFSRGLPVRAFVRLPIRSAFRGTQHKPGWGVTPRRKRKPIPACHEGAAASPGRHSAGSSMQEQPSSLQFARHSVRRPRHRSLHRSSKVTCGFDHPLAGPPQQTVTKSDRHDIRNNT